MSNASRRGLWLLPAAGLLTGLPWLVFFDPQSGGEGSNPHAEAVSTLSLGNQVASYAYIAGFVCLLIGVIALIAYVAARGRTAWSAPALVLDVIVISLVLPVEGVLVLAGPLASTFYLAGHGDVGQLLIHLSGGSLAPSIDAWLMVALAVALAGGVVTGFAIWRSGVGRWSGVLIAAGFVLTVAITPVVSWIGAALLVGGGSWLAFSSRRMEFAGEGIQLGRDRVAEA